jgi:hypothetical protein
MVPPLPMMPLTLAWSIWMMSSCSLMRPARPDIGDLVLQTHERLGIAIHGTGGADEARGSRRGCQHGDFFTVQAQAHDGAEEGVHA